MMKSLWGSSLILTALTAFGSSVHADDALSKLSVHGFLTQAYGDTLGKSVTVLGITSAGTTDYRTAALQFSYAVTEKDRLVVQLSHERIGIDAKAVFLSDVAMDWVFYQHNFSDDTLAKVGRVPLPLGIYNEIRDVGTLLPFYRPPNAFYNETTFLSETLDGVLASHTFHAKSWSLAVEPFAGGWNSLAISGSSPLTRARADSAWGVNSWLTTPVSGLRVGGSHFRATLKRGLVATIAPTTGTTATPAPQPAPEPRRVTMFSVDGNFTHVTARAEYFRTKDGDSRDRAYYALLTVRPVEKVGVNFQYSKFWVSWYGGPLKGVVSGGSRDLAAGVSYAYKPNIVLKLEGHDGEGIGVRVPPPINRYFLASLAASF